MFEQATRLLTSWQRTMVLSHVRTDGDALGAMGTMTRAIEAAGRVATALVFEEVPPRYRFIEELFGFHRWPVDQVAELDGRFDGILILDTCSWQQLEPAASYLRTSRLPKIVVDHHATRDDLSGGRTADVYIIEPAAASTCVLLYQWLGEADWPIDAEVAEALFAGMATDTGWFRFSNTDPATLRAAAALIEAGVQPDLLYARLYASHSPARIRLMGEMLSTLTLHEGGSVAVMSLTPAMFERAGAVQTDAEDLVNEPLAAGPVTVSILLTDTGSGEIRVNFRSKSPEVCGRNVDMAGLARQFGGGGHRRAAGARIKGSLEAVRERVTAAAIAALEQR